METIKATEILVSEGFQVMVYTNDDPIIAKRFEDMGCVAVMPLAAPIGSGLGIRNPYNILTIVENARVPILVDAERARDQVPVRRGLRLLHGQQPRIDLLLQQRMISYNFV